MHPRVIPADEGRRLAAVKELRLVGTPAEERFDRITRLARRLLDVPVALIDLVGDARVWFKSAAGLDATDGPRDASYCQYTILGGGICYIEDSLKDDRLEGNPNRQKIRFYAGMPLKFEGHNVGTLCAFDFMPRHFGYEDLASLSDLAKLAEREISILKLSEAQIALAEANEALEHKSLVDPLTRLWNRGAIFEVAARELERARTCREPLGLAMLDLDHFKAINDTHGHPGGDEVLRITADRLRVALRPGDAAGRYGGEEFLLVLPGCDEAGMAEVAERIRASVGLAVDFRGAAIPVTASVGTTVSAEGAHLVELLVRAADEALYRAKRMGRNRVEARRVTVSFMKL